MQRATRNDLSEKTRAGMIKLLNARLADTTDLATQAKAAHWNVKGPHFISLHELFDKVYEHAAEATDLIAERAVQLGGVAEGTARAAARNSTLPEYPGDIFTSRDHVNAVSDRLAAVGKLYRDAINAADEMGDKGTADIFTEISRQNDKMLWFVEAHNQAKE